MIVVCHGLHHARVGGGGPAGESSGSKISRRQSQSGKGSPTVQMKAAFLGMLSSAAPAATPAFTAPATATMGMRDGGGGGGEEGETQAEMTNGSSLCSVPRVAEVAAPFHGTGRHLLPSGLTILSALGRRLLCSQSSKHLLKGGGVSVYGSWHRLMRRRPW